MKTRFLAVLLLLAGCHGVLHSEFQISLGVSVPASFTIEISSSNPEKTYDVLFSPSIFGPFETLYRGILGQRSFTIPPPESEAGFFRAIEKSEPLLTDFDGDGISNEEELLHGTDPFSQDTDGDGVPDKDDIAPLDPSEGIRLVFDPTDKEPPKIFLEVPADAVLLP